MADQTTSEPSQTPATAAAVPQSNHNDTKSNEQKPVEIANKEESTHSTSENATQTQEKDTEKKATTTEEAATPSSTEAQTESQSPSSQDGSQSTTNTNANKNTKSGGSRSRTNSKPRSRSNSTNNRSVTWKAKGDGTQGTTRTSPRGTIALQVEGPAQISDGVITGESHQLQTPWTWWFSRKAKRGRVNSITGGPNVPPPGGVGFKIGALRPDSIDADGGEEDLSEQTKGPKSKQQQQNFDDLEHRGGLSQICTCTTVEEFWAQYCYLQRPSQLPKESNYYFFRHSVEPMWETFPKGGCFIVRIKKKGNSLNQLWEELLFATIGEAFEEPSVMGVVVSIRSKEDALSVWTKTNSKNIRHYVGEKLKALLGLDKNLVVTFKTNASAIRDKSTYKNAKKIFVAN